MAKAFFNPSVSGFSGRSAGFVYRRVRGQTIVAIRPEASERPPTPAQLAQRERFIQAAAYVRRVLSDPWQRRLYEGLGKERNRRADKLVAADFLTPPVVEDLDVSQYKGRAGDTIRTLATDDIEVVSVEVTIRTADGAAVEQGSAAKIHGVWCYRTTAAPPENTALVVTAAAKDRPGNVATRSVTYVPGAVTIS